MPEGETTASKRPGRNEPCHCGSGRKYKQCCLAKDEEADRTARAEAAAKTAPATESAERKQRTPPPKRPTDQPWKGSTKNMGGFHKVSGPRKIGSS